jgi:hypothetical protein
MMFEIKPESQKGQRFFQRAGTICQRDQTQNLQATGNDTAVHREQELFEFFWQLDAGYSLQLFDMSLRSSSTHHAIRLARTLSESREKILVGRDASRVPSLPV